MNSMRPRSCIRCGRRMSAVVTLYKGSQHLSCIHDLVVQCISINANSSFLRFECWSSQLKFNSAALSDSQILKLKRKKRGRIDLNRMRRRKIFFFFEKMKNKRQNETMMNTKLVCALFSSRSLPFSFWCWCYACMAIGRFERAFSVNVSAQFSTVEKS